jgi:hypothetical protein
MRIHRIESAVHAVAAATLLAALLAGCGKSAEPEAVPSPPPAPAETIPADPASPTESPTAPAQPSASPPPPSDPSPAPKPTANEPGVESMHAATASAKISVPVELRYQFDGAVLPNQPVTLHLAAVARVAGTHLNVSVKQAPGLRVDAQPLSVQKVSAAGVYRQQLSITLSDGAPAALRVLVTMDLAEGSGFGFFTVPLEAGTAAQKQESVKQR